MLAERVNYVGALQLQLLGNFILKSCHRYVFSYQTQLVENPITPLTLTSRTALIHISLSCMYLQIDVSVKVKFMIAVDLFAAIYEYSSVISL